MAFLLVETAALMVLCAMGGDGRFPEMALGNDCPVLAHVLFDPRASSVPRAGRADRRGVAGTARECMVSAVWCSGGVSFLRVAGRWGCCTRRRLRMPSRAGSPRIAVEEVEKAAGSSHHVDADGRNP